MGLMECLEKANLPKNQTVLDNFVRAHKIVNDPRYKNIMCSISGGSDSDIMLDIIGKVDEHHKVHYVWFDTGLEYQATKDHLVYLENKYGIKIERERAIKPIPTCCREYGQPFLSKNVSSYISRLQKHNFDFKDYNFEYMLQHYGKDIAEWWCNCKKNDQFNINRNRYLKEFLIQNPPKFKISNLCCKYAKKEVSSSLIKERKYDLVIIGVRKAEGGIRATAYKNCYDCDREDYDKYRPLFWYLDSDKIDYEKSCNIVHSDCYKVWGFKRTGCCGCPYNIKIQKDLFQVKRYEPKLYKAVNNVFKDSYEYTKQYRQFVQDMKRKEKGRKKLF